MTTYELTSRLEREDRIAHARVRRCWHTHNPANRRTNEAYREVGEAIGVSAGTLKRWVARGLLDGRVRAVDAKGRPRTYRGRNTIDGIDRSSYDAQRTRVGHTAQQYELPFTDKENKQ